MPLPPRRDTGLPDVLVEEAGLDSGIRGKLLDALEIRVKERQDLIGLKGLVQLYLRA
jgi:hypothetical protein